MKKLLKVLPILILSTLLTVSAVYIYNNFIKQPGIPSVNRLIKEKKQNNYNDKDDNKIDINAYQNPLPSYREMYGNYDIMGRIEIPNIGIDALITRTNNNTYYLDYSLYHEWDGLGVPFFDYRNTNLSNDLQVNIYGHNTQREEFYDQLPFTNLEAYVDEGIFNNYKDVYLSLDERQVHYEIVAVKILPDSSNNEHMKVIFYSQQDYLNHLSRMLENSLYRSENAYFTADDRVLVLQICHYDPMGSYLLVICKEKK